MSELIDQRKGIDDFRNELESWIARDSISLNPEKFEVGSPEYALNIFLNCWIKKNYGNMTEILPTSKSEIKPPLRIKKHFQERFLKSFKYNSINDVGLSNTTICVSLEIEKRGRLEEKDYNFIMLAKDENGTIISRNNKSAKWYSHDWKVL